MGTKEEQIAKTQFLQSEIKKLIKKLGWSEQKFAAEIYTLKFPDDDWDEDNNRKRFYETFKKQLTRNTTPSEILSEYLRLISQNEEVKKAGIIVPCFYKTGLFPDDKIDFMLEISKAATKLARNHVRTTTS